LHTNFVESSFSTLAKHALLMVLTGTAAVRIWI